MWTNVIDIRDFVTTNWPTHKSVVDYIDKMENLRSDYYGFQYQQDGFVTDIQIRRILKWWEKVR